MRASPGWRSGLGQVVRGLFPPVQVREEVKALACELPGERGVPLSRFKREIAREAVARGIVEQMSGVTVWRWLAEDAIRPWNYRSSIFPAIPTSGKGRPGARPLRRTFGRRAAAPGDFVLCADEKPSIQARARLHPGTRPARRRGSAGRARIRAARRALLPRRLGVKRAKLFDRCEAKGGIMPFDRLVEQLMTTRPYAYAPRVFLVIDNGSAHRGQRSIDRLQGD